MKVFETERLILRPFEEKDYPYFLEVFSDAEVAKFIGGVKAPEQIWRLLATYIGHYHMKSYGKMAVVEKSTNEFLGSTGLWNSEPWPELELGYWYRKSAQGKGYATEAAGIMKDYAFNQLNADTLVSYIAPLNIPSQKLAERLGAFNDKTINLLGFGEHYVFRYKK